MPARKLKLFVSYAHADFQPLLDFDTTRASQIYELVRKSLKIGSERCRFETLRDEENFLEPGELVVSEIEDALRQADCALVFLSSSYLESDWCCWEYLELVRLRRFIQVIELERPDPTEDLSPNARAVLEDKARRKHLPMWEQSKIGKDDIVYGSPLVRPDDPHVQKIMNMCSKLASALQSRALSVQMAEGGLAEAHRRDTATREASAGDIKVLFAAPTRDVQSHKNRLAERLLEAGYHICDADFDPDHHDPVGKFAQSLSGCSMVIQILGDMEGREITVTDESQVGFQYRLANDTGVPVICWRGGSAPVEELSRSYRRDLANLPLEVTDFSGFQAYVLQLLEKAARSHRIETENPDRSKPNVFLDGDASDNALVISLRDFLAREQAAVTIVSYDDGKQIQQELEEAAEKNDAAVLIFGPERASQRRANTHFTHLIQHLEKGQDASQKRLRSMAIGNSAAPDAPHPAAEEVAVLRLYDTFDLDEVRGFLQYVRQRMEAAADARAD